MPQQQNFRRNGSPTVAGIWNTYRLNIAGTFGLLLTERCLGIAVPFVLGVAINDLIAESYRGTIWLIALVAMRLIIGVTRRLYDTRIYARIYTDIADGTARRTDTTITRRAARLGLARELVDFYEWELPELLAALIGMIGAFGMLIYLLPSVGSISVIVGVLLGFVFSVSRGRILSLNKLLNNELERQVTMLESAREFSRIRHLGRLARWRINLSDLEATNFAIAELLLGALTIGSVVITVRAGLSVGEVFAVLTYLMSLSENLVVLPWTFQQSIRAREIGERIASA